MLSLRNLLVFFFIVLGAAATRAQVEEHRSQIKESPLSAMHSPVKGFEIGDLIEVSNDLRLIRSDKQEEVLSSSSLPVSFFLQLRHDSKSRCPSGQVAVQMLHYENGDVAPTSFGDSVFCVSGEELSKGKAVEGYLRARQENLLPVRGSRFLDEKRKEISFLGEDALDPNGIYQRVVEEISSDSRRVMFYEKVLNENGDTVFLVLPRYYSTHYGWNIKPHIDRKADYKEYLGRAKAKAPHQNKPSTLLSRRGSQSKAEPRKELPSSEHKSHGSSLLGADEALQEQRSCGRLETVLPEKFEAGGVLHGCRKENAAAGFATINPETFDEPHDDNDPWSTSLRVFKGGNLLMGSWGLEGAMHKRIDVGPTEETRKTHLIPKGSLVEFLGSASEFDGLLNSSTDPKNLVGVRVLKVQNEYCAYWPSGVCSVRLMSSGDEVRKVSVVKQGMEGVVQLRNLRLMPNNTLWVLEDSDFFPAELKDRKVGLPMVFESIEEIPQHKSFYVCDDGRRFLRLKTFARQMGERQLEVAYDLTCKVPKGENIFTYVDQGSFELFQRVFSLSSPAQFVRNSMGRVLFPAFDTEFYNDKDFHDTPMLISAISGLHFNNAKARVNGFGPPPADPHAMLETMKEIRRDFDEIEKDLMSGDYHVRQEHAELFDDIDYFTYNTESSTTFSANGDTHVPVDRWMEEPAACALGKILNEWKRHCVEELMQRDDIPKIEHELYCIPQVGDMSTMFLTRKGLSGRLLGHVTHREGVCVDFRPLDTESFHPGVLLRNEDTNETWPVQEVDYDWRDTTHGDMRERWNVKAGDESATFLSNYFSRFLFDHGAGKVIFDVPYTKDGKDPFAKSDDGEVAIKRGRRGHANHIHACFPSQREWDKGEWESRHGEHGLAYGGRKIDKDPLIAECYE